MQQDSNENRLLPAGRVRCWQNSLIFIAAAAIFALLTFFVNSLRPLGFLRGHFFAGNAGFLVPSNDTSLSGFIQTATQRGSSFYRVNFRGRTHHSATVAISESRGDDHGKCGSLHEAQANENTIPFQLSAGYGVVFTHSTALMSGGRIGWMQLLFDDQGSCLEISAKGLSTGDLEPQDLILMLSSLHREPRS